MWEPYLKVHYSHLKLKHPTRALNPVIRLNDLRLKRPRRASKVVMWEPYLKVHYSHLKALRLTLRSVYHLVHFSHLLGQGQAADLALHHRGGAGGPLWLGQVGVLLVRGHHLGLIKHGLLIIRVEPLHKLLLVPLEVVEQYPHSSCWYLNHSVHLLDTLNHVLHYLLSSQYLKEKLILYLWPSAAPWLLTQPYVHPKIIILLTLRLLLLRTLIS